MSANNREIGHYDWSLCKVESAGNAVLKEFGLPRLKSNEVLLEADYSVISAGTERANLLGMPNTGTREEGFPYHPGYCRAGRVIDAGKDVSNLEPGDRAIIAWGGHRSHLIKKAETVLKIDSDSIDSLDAAFANIVSFSLLGVRKLRIELGESVMVAGVGILGAFALQIAELSGGVPVVVSELDPARRKLALELGAAAAFSPAEDDFIEKVKSATGGKGPDAVVEVTGSAAALQQALECVA